MIEKRLIENEWITVSGPYRAVNTCDGWLVVGYGEVHVVEGSYSEANELANQLRRKREAER